VTTEVLDRAEAAEVKVANKISNEEATLPYEEGFVCVYTGVKGSGKDGCLARDAMRLMSCCNKEVYSNLPMGGKLPGWYDYDFENEEYIYHESPNYEVKPLPDNFFVTLGKGVPPRSVVCISELGKYFNNQDWQRLDSKMGIEMFGEIRKLNLYIFGNTQYFHHLNPRLAEQVDLLVRVKDLSKESWGKEHYLGKGEEILLDLYDLCGDFSDNGKCARSEFQPNVINGKSYKSEVLFLKAYWEFYDSHKLVGLQHRFQQYYIEKQKIKVNPVTGETINLAEAQNTLRKFLIGAVNDAVESGMEEIRVMDIQSMCYADGFDVSPAQVGIALKNLGLATKYFRNREGKAGTWCYLKRIKTNE
jgi:hypothetical protein